MLVQYRTNCWVRLNLISVVAVDTEQLCFWLQGDESEYVVQEEFYASFCSSLGLEHNTILGLLSRDTTT